MSGRITSPVGHSGASQSYHSVSPSDSAQLWSTSDISSPVPASTRLMPASRHRGTPQLVLVSASIVQSSKQAGQGRPSVAKTYSYKGVEYIFADTVSKDLICPVCHELLDEAQQTPCGHLFCMKCLEKTKTAKQSYTGGVSMECPLCRSKYSRAAYADAYNDRRVKSLEIKCPNQPCQWTGALSEVVKHKKSHCQHERVKCPKECGEEMTREHLPQHQKSICPLRAHCCQFCNKQDTYKNITTNHYENCERFPLPCPNKCGKQRIPKKELEHHLAECPEQMVKCLYAEMGCQDTVARRHLDSHKEVRKDHHLSLAVERVSQLCGAVSQLYSVCEEQCSRQRQLESQLKELHASDHYHSSKPYNPYTAQTEEKIKRPAFSCQRNWLENDKVFPSMPWVVKVADFESAKASDSVIESRPFFTQPAGYQFCLRVHPNGNGSKHTSAFIAPMAGPSDEYLQWPFKCTFRITILNQLADNKHTSAEVEITANRLQPPKVRESGKGRNKFISHGGLQRKESLNRQYLMDDCAYFRVMLLPGQERVRPMQLQVVHYQY